MIHYSSICLFSVPCGVHTIREQTDLFRIIPGHPDKCEVRIVCKLPPRLPGISISTLLLPMICTVVCFNFMMHMLNCHHSPERLAMHHSQVVDVGYQALLSSA